MKHFYKILLLAILIISSCSEDVRDMDNDQLLNEPQVNLISNYDDFSFDLDAEDKSLKFRASINDGKVVSSLFFEDESYETSIVYDFDTNIDHWKLFQSDKVVSKSQELLSSNISKELLDNVSNTLEKIYLNNYQNLHLNTDPELISVVNYYNSILIVASSAIQEERDCECTVHPAFLVGKTNFNCQENQYLNVKELKEILHEYTLISTSIDSSTTELINFLNSTNKDSIQFGELYSFYISQDNYSKMLSRFLKPSSDKESTLKACRWYCVIGCGSDWGCCSNYSGCCLYRTVLCFIHDWRCTNCDYWHCGPKCVPDFSGTTR